MPNNSNHNRNRGGPDPFIDLGPAYEILDAIHRHDEEVARANIRQIDELRAKVVSIRRHPAEKSARSFNQSTITGSLLTALGVQKGNKPSEAESNVEEIDRREKEAREKKKSMAAETAIPASAGKDESGKDSGKGNRKRSRTRQGVS